MILEFLSRLPFKSLRRLSCTSKYLYNTAFVIDVWNFTTNELLRIIPPVIGDNEEDASPTNGFGYTIVRGQGFVYTFGTKSSWKQINLPGQRATACLQGTFTPYGGGGALFWMTLDPRIILQFDIHQDKFQYLIIPLARNECPTSKDHIRLFELAGFLGVAVFLWKSNATTTLEKVHLKLYKDSQVWLKKTIDISTCSIPYTAKFRFISFYDQILLHWMDPNSFQFFNLQSKCLKVVQKLASGIWENGLPKLAKDEDYWLNREVQNISSLRTLLPERAQKSDFES
ncbi:hypothetical protein MKW92_042467, partial [Papaver armeniacum]